MGEGCCGAIAQPRLVGCVSHWATVIGFVESLESHFLKGLRASDEVLSLACSERLQHSWH